ncbi:hypothetical protein N7456_004186 [Penicillium angulare]|uniref:Uncharacterized protein n=1 Tax=Penicillium angulare TaxID=116970 RepID=A0A9W9FW39_9EURO|nr:hypothetical protein N7456_004186 [Penicillium angulare]
MYSYDEVEASTITHRASAEYKAFRVAVGEKRLLEQPSDLRFWRPTNIGFLTRKVHMNSFKNQSHGKNYIVIDELTPASGEYKHIFELLSKISLKAEKTQEVLSFWVLQREDGDKTAFLVFTSYVERDYWALFNAQTEIQDHWATLYDLSKDWSRTTWMGPGLGFLGR